MRPQWLGCLHDGNTVVFVDYTVILRNDEVKREKEKHYVEFFGQYGI